MQSLYQEFAREESVLARYPHTFQLGDDNLYTVTPMVPSDWPMLAEFVRATPDQERRFFRYDMDDQARVEWWCSQLNYHELIPLLVWHEDQIIADGILERDAGIWTSHVGRIRLLVHPDWRQKGVGQALIQELIELGTQLKLHRLVYECASDQPALLALLAKNGFRTAATIKEHLLDGAGILHDMHVMIYDLSHGPLTPRTNRPQKDEFGR